MQIGDTIRSLDGDYGTVEAISIVDQSQTMYNLTVDEAHTFFVGDGEWLVHNTCDFPDFGETQGWSNRAKNPSRADGPGIYEYFRYNDPNKPLVDESSSGLRGRLYDKRKDWNLLRIKPEPWDRITYTELDLNKIDRSEWENVTRAAERMRQEQLRIKYPNVLGGASTASRDQVMNVWNNKVKEGKIPNWPAWLTPPDDWLK